LVNGCSPIRRWMWTCALLLIPITAHAQGATVPGDITSYSTIYSIGVEWDIANDSNHDARVDVEFKPSSSSTWLPASPLIRVDYNGRNMLAGSVMFLSPDTSYQIRLTLFDPDGGGETREVSVRTQKLPVAPVGGRVFHVVPGSGGGDGTSGSPFRGVDAAQAVARPGDTFLMHAGFYGSDRLVFAVGGAPDAYIAWKAAGDGEVTIDGFDIYRSHLWFEGLTVRDQRYGTRTDGAPADVVIIRCAFINNFYNIYLSGGGSGWYIADNTIYGATPYLSQSDEGEGIELNGTSGHTVAHNSITNVADGLSTPRTNVDIFGNDIFNTADDGLELDFGLANVRAWRNRIHNAYHNGISFQPQNGGPWYIIRNQIVGSAESPFKFRTTDRFVLLHNTIVNFAGSMICCSQTHLLRGLVRNNLWISAQGGQIWNFDALSDWRTDVDYDGFDWGDATYPMVWAGAIYYDLPSFARASGLEAHGIRVDRDGCLSQFQVPGPTPTEIPPQVMTLSASCNAIDAGAILPNLSEPFTGAAPDLGAYEYGLPAPTFGPRPASPVLSVALVSPGPGNTFSAPASLTMQAAVTGAGGAYQVDFYGNGVYFGSASASPYAIAVNGLAYGAYALTARVTDATGASAPSAPVTIMVMPATAGPSSSLPQGFSDQDVGSVSRVGSARGDGTSWVIAASGADIWGSADAFHYAYRSLSGNGSITAQVVSMTNTNVWAKAGVMMREDLGSGSRHAFMLITPGEAEGFAFQRRPVTGGDTLHTAAGSGSPPQWVRLSRNGSVITAEYSPDGATWTFAGSESMPMGATILVGLAVTSHDDALTASATFDNVRVDSTDGSTASSLAAPWIAGDIGVTGAPGSVSLAGDSWTVRGSGADVWDNVDAFQYVTRSLAGDGEIVARVSSLAGANPWAKAGVMMRESRDPSSPHAFALVTPAGANGIAFQRRDIRGDISLHTAGPPLAASVWLKLTRRGNLVTASWSSDGQTWFVFAADTIAMSSMIDVGLAVTSHDAGTLATAIFDHVTVTAGSS
jgi:regulation of enolase protein 1 (concanavalin A-like superfamily)